MPMQAVDAAQITAQQKATWDRFADTYTEVVISKDYNDPATLQVISAIKSHKELATGEQITFKLEERCTAIAGCRPANMPGS